MRSSGSRLRATVIVCTRSRLPLLKACLSALQNQTFGEFDILVVDNGRLPEARALCANIGVGYLHEPRPGLSLARNAGIRAATGDIIAFIDDDAVPDPDWLAELVGEFTDDAIAAVTGTIQYMQAVGETRAMSSEIVEAGAAARPRAVFGTDTPRWFSAACFGGIGDGGNMAFRRALLSHSPAFDDRLGRGRTLDGGEEHVLFARILQSGYFIAHNPGALVRHPYPADAELRQARMSADLRTSIAYLLFLFAEFPCHRMDLLGFVVRAMLKRLPGCGGRRGARLRRANAIKAMLLGPGLYLQARREWRRSSIPQAAPDPIERGSYSRPARFGRARSVE